MKICAEKGCPELVESGRCAKHRQAVEQQRGSARARGYTHDWDKYSKDRLAKFPYCVGFPVGVHTTPTLANVTDHVKAAAQFPQLFWDPANHQSLCFDCNSRKNIAEEGGFAIPQRGQQTGTPSRVVVCGPPGSGKSTWVRAHSQPGDLVWDLDDVASVIGNCGREIPRDQRGHLPWHLMKACLQMRDGLLTWLASTEIRARVFVIIANETEAESIGRALHATVKRFNNNVQTGQGPCHRGV